MRKFSKELAKERLKKATENLDKVFKVLPPILLAVLIAALIFWLIKNPGSPFNRKPQPSPQPSPQTIFYESPSPQPPQSTPSAATKSASKKGCCTNLSGKPIPYPPTQDCLGQFSTGLTNLDQIVKSVKEQTGLVLGGITNETEFNGYVTSSTVNNSLKYTVHLYQTDALNNEYTPPYRYKATSCTPELKEKLEKVLNP